MGRISSSTGLVSGIDTKSIIDQLMSLESRGKNQIQTRIEGVNEQKLAYTDLSTRLTTLKLSGTALKKPSTFQASSTTSNNEDVLTATASNGAAVGSYQFQVARLVTSQQSVTRGFADTTTAKVGAGTLTVELGGGELTNQTTLAELNGGHGVRRGAFRVTDRSGASAVVDIGNSVTVDDVVAKINTSLGVTVRASVAGDKLVLTDLTGKALSDLSVADLAGGSSAADLGIAGTSLGTDLITGADVRSVGLKTQLDDVNDGRGVRRSASGNDFTVTVGDGTAIGVALGAAKSVGEVVDLINAAGTTKLKAEVVPGANGIKLTDTSGGGGAFTVAAVGTSQAAADLGLTAPGVAGVITGGDLVAGIDTVMLSSLRGGTGIPLGQVTITDRGGQSATVDLSAARSVQDVIDAISNAAGVRVTASLKPSQNGIQITDDSAGTGDLVIADAGAGTTAAVLGVAGTFTTATTAVQGANLQRQWVTENTALSVYSGGKGVTPGKITITTANGGTASVEITDTDARLGDVIKKINDKAIGVTASINANGDGLLLTDTTGGPGKLKVDEDGATTAADLNIKGTATAATIDGSFEKTITVDAADTLTSVQQKINDLRYGVGASIVNDGSPNAPYRLSLTARNTGRAGRVTFDGGATAVQASTLVAAQDAAVFLGSGEAGAQPLLVTSNTNQIANVIQGVTLDLHGTSDKPVTLAVTRSPDALVEQITRFADGFNETVDKLKELTKFDAETNEKGLLLGESTAQTIEQNLYAMFNGVVAGAGKYRVAADAGVKLVDGKIEFDEDKFRAAYATDPDSLQALFTTAPNALVPATPVTRLNSGRGLRTAANGLADFRVTTKDGTVTDVTLGSVTTLGEVLTKINTAGGTNFKAEIAADGASLKLTDTSAAGATPFALTALNGSIAASDLKLTKAAADGVIAGEKVFDVTSQLSLAAGTGIGYLIENSMARLIDPVDGAIARQNKTLDEKTAQFQDRIDALDKSLTSKRERLERQFSQMESVLANLQGQQSALSGLQSAVR
jgi:flagellar hook-associated protein 2